MDWQPIETVPKDGSVVMLRTTGGNIHKGAWNPDRVWYEVNRGAWQCPTAPNGGWLFHPAEWAPTGEAPR